MIVRLPHPHLLGWARVSTDDLMLLAQNGDALAFEELYYRMLPVIRGFLDSRAESATPVDDIVQEVFCRLWEHQGRFARQSSARTYLTGIALNVLHEDRRGRIKAIPLTTDNSEYLAVEDESTDVSWCDGLISDTGRARARLSKKQQAAVQLVYDEQLTPQEAAERLRCSEQAIRRRLQEARRKIYGWLKRNSRSMLLKP